MTFDFNPSSPLALQPETTPPRRDVYSEYATGTQSTKTTPSKSKEKTHDYCETRQIADWEDEGGARSGGARGLSGDHSLGHESALATHIGAAEDLLNGGDYDAAFSELQSAAKRFLAYKEEINQSFNRSIAHLTTPGGQGTPPHPTALPLIRLRRQIRA